MARNEKRRQKKLAKKTAKRKTQLVGRRHEPMARGLGTLVGTTPETGAIESYRFGFRRWYLARWMMRSERI